MIDTSFFRLERKPIVIPAITDEDTTGLWATQKEDPTSPFRVRRFDANIVLPKREAPTKETVIQSYTFFGADDMLKAAGGEAEVRSKYLLSQHQLRWLIDYFNPRLAAMSPTSMGYVCGDPAGLEFWNFAFVLDENGAMAYMQFDWREGVDWRACAAPIDYQVAWGSTSISGGMQIFLPVQ